MFKNCRFIELTHDLTAKAPTWNGSCGFHAEIKMDYPQGLRVMAYKMHAGVGTHMDAPCHFFKDTRSIAEIPLEQLIVPIAVIDVSAKRAPDLLISCEDIALYESRYGKILEGAFVAGYTGWEAFWEDSDKYRNLDSQGRMHFPGFSKEAVELLLKRKIVGIGIDALSPDGSTVGPNAAFPIHHLILGSGRYILENMANLAQMPPFGAYLIALPPKIEGGAEAPVRAVGVISVYN